MITPTARRASLTFARGSSLIIKALALTNFRSFVRADLKFAPGQNYVFGHNWQGKSSIVDAVGFALFGVDIFPKKVAGTAVKADHLVNERSTRGGVELAFDLDGMAYCLKRQLPGRDVVLSRNGETIATGVRTVTEKLVGSISTSEMASGADDAAPARSSFRSAFGSRGSRPGAARFARFRRASLRSPKTWTRGK